MSLVIRTVKSEYLPFTGSVPSGLLPMDSNSSHIVNHLIFAASKFGDFKRLANVCSLIVALSQLNALQSDFLLLYGLLLRERICSL